MRDADDPTRLRRVRSEAELETRVEAAIDAWRELGPDGSGRFAEDDLVDGARAPQPVARRLPKAAYEPRERGCERSCAGSRDAR